MEARATVGTSLVQRPTRMAFIGYQGHQGSEYLAAVALLANVEVVALVDTVASGPPPGVARGTPVYTSSEAMLKEVVPDIALIAVPHDAHYGVIRALVSAGSHVIVEKPLVPDLASAERLYELSARTGRSIVTTTQRPLRPEFRYLRTVLGEIGPTYWLDWRYHMAFPEPSKGWRAKWERSRGGVLLDMGYHVIDMLIRLFGKARPVAATKRYRYDQSRLEGLEDLMSVTLDFPEQEIGGHILVARHARAKSESLEIHGTRGVIDADIRHPSVTVYGEDGSPLHEYTGSAVAVDAPAVVLGHYLKLAANHDMALRQIRHHVDVVAVCEESYRIADAVFEDTDRFQHQPRKADAHT